jgi:transcriptional regulator with XRE-family HTH domain
MEAGLRQVDMAKALGKPQAFVSYYESGARRLDLLELRQICGILGVPLVDLVKKFEKLLQ